jgi:hypothetical protein
MNFGSFLTVNAGGQLDISVIEELKIRGEYCDKATMDCKWKNLKGKETEY